MKNEYINLVLDCAVKNGITNKYSQAAILSIIDKESEFELHKEKSYENTPNIRIRKIFGVRVEKFSEDQLNDLKKDYNAFFEQVYGMKWEKYLGLGNDQPGDGAKYVGRGFNQITGKYLYKKASEDTGIDLVSNPDLLLKPDVAAFAAIQYFKRQFLLKTNKLSKYNSTSINDFKSLQDAVGAFYHANAGWGKSFESLQLDQTGGRKRAFSKAQYFLTLVQKK